MRLTHEQRAEFLRLFHLAREKYSKEFLCDRLNFTPKQYDRLVEHEKLPHIEQVSRALRVLRELRNS